MRIGRAATVFAVICVALAIINAPGAVFGIGLVVLAIWWVAAGFGRHARRTLGGRR